MGWSGPSSPGAGSSLCARNPTQDLEEQVAAYKAENGVTARDILVIRFVGLAEHSNGAKAGRRIPVKLERYAIKAIGVVINSATLT